MDSNQAYPLYQEPHRPQYHFSPAEGWMNDPNGMVYFEGEYHLFFQYYPYGNIWGPMHWGHAVSEDLVHWEELPIALYPDSVGLIFSGSAVIDWNNSSGFGDGKTPPMVAMYTSHNMIGERSLRDDFQTQSIAYSLDKGRTWTKYEGNPVIPNLGIRDFRDPKVFWHAGTEQWVMVLAAKDRIQIFQSPNLIEWKLASEIGQDHPSQLGVWECPDLFPLPVEGTDEEKWVMIISHGGGGPNGGSCTRYQIGDFDGTTFTNADPADTIRWLDWGKDNYAGVTWSDVPAEDGRRLFIGWMSNWEYAKRVPTTKWRSAMTIPRSLHLVNDQGRPTLVARPVEELQALRESSVSLGAETITGKRRIEGLDPSTSEWRFQFDFAASFARDFGVELSNKGGDVLRIHYDLPSDLIIVDRSNSGITEFAKEFQRDLHYLPCPPAISEMDWHLFFDKSSIELFVNGGKYVLTDIFFPHEDYDQISLFAHDGTLELQEGVGYALGGVWE